jgi:hypothetical protein
MHPAVVNWVVEGKCAQLEETKQRQLWSTTNPVLRRSISRAYNAMIREERKRYATVKVVRTKKVRRLCYDGEKPSMGTGPFATVEEAVAWFLDGGR